MEYTYKDIDKIVEFSSWTERQKLDELLRIDCALYATLGIDSTNAEREQVKRMSRAIYKRIRKVNEVKGRLFMETMDTKV
jgi:hypothetical protein|tara:strand:- start:311 stop:550 length:240 start_codon:yes stop_codon:yes gene_type:complete